MKSYWNKRFGAEGKIWGDSPSRTTYSALEIFRRNNVRKILVPGSGYGRNTRLFSTSGYEVTGIEISSIACQLAGEFDPLSRVFHASVQDMSFDTESYDAIYCFNVLHLFTAEQRNSFIQKCLEKTRDNGIMYFTVFSEKEPTYGKGQEIEKNTYESKPGRPTHYFTDEDLKAHFKETEVLETGIIEDSENHGEEGPHTHILRYICLRKAVKGSK